MNDLLAEAEDVSVSRLEAFSDGVIAIIITIMVLDLRPPHEATAIAMLDLWPTFASYGLSFLIVAIYWVNHRHVVRYATKVSPALLWVNMLVLFTISLIPFATAWLGDHLDQRAPNMTYGTVLIAGAVTFLIFSEIVYRQNQEHKEFQDAIRTARVKGAITLAMYVLGMLSGEIVPGAVFVAAGLAAVMHFAPAYIAKK